jgi:hypothetical protein
MPIDKQQAALAKARHAKTVAFRLAPDHFSDLKARADLAGQSTGDLARTMVLECLDNTGRLDQVQQQLTDMHVQLDELRRDFVASVEAILVCIATRQTLTTEDAKRWVQDNLRPK